MQTDGFRDLTDLNRWLAERNIEGLWSSSFAQREEVKPCLWKWSDMYAGLMASADLVPIESVPMRVLVLKNPALGFITGKTVHITVQCLMPGERTREAHRNLVSETRFVLKGPPGAIFIVDGEAFPMGEGDLITTPNWSWHDHYNGGNEPAIWLDGLDRPLVRALGKDFSERFPQLHQPIERSGGYSAKTLGHARPSRMRTDGPVPPPFHYRWEETQATLMALRENEADLDPWDGIHLTYANPLTGGPTLPTYACEIQLLTPGMKTRSHRHNSTTIYHAFRGSGATVVEGEELAWSQGDIFALPAWCWHRHENRADGDALLYSITDRPAVSALGLYREESAAAD